jgi:hypothetical protein
LGLIYAQRPTTHLEAIRLLDCVLRLTGCHIDERKSARAPGLPIVDEFDGFDFAVALENRTHFVFCCGEWQVANVDRRHSTSLTTDARSAGSLTGTPLARGFKMQTPAPQRRGLYHRPYTNTD